jgi:hypothetical protein
MPAPGTIGSHSSSSIKASIKNELPVNDHGFVCLPNFSLVAARDIDCLLALSIFFPFATTSRLGRRGCDVCIIVAWRCQVRKVISSALNDRWLPGLRWNE